MTSDGTRAQSSWTALLDRLEASTSLIRISEQGWGMSGTSCGHHDITEVLAGWVYHGWVWIYHGWVWIYHGWLWIYHGWLWIYHGWLWIYHGWLWLYHRWLWLYHWWLRFGDTIPALLLRVRICADEVASASPTVPDAENFGVRGTLAVLAPGGGSSPITFTSTARYGDQKRCAGWLSGNFCTALRDVCNRFTRLKNRSRNRLRNRLNNRFLRIELRIRAGA